MSTAQPKQVIRVGEQQIVLPDGVTVSEWGLEKVTVQNPRIRAFLGCIRLLGGVLESNYAILHCSPERLLEIWRKVSKVAELIRYRIGPLLRSPSRIPALEQARLDASSALEMLESAVLIDLEKFPKTNVGPHRLMELRKLLCVSIGQLHSFLQDTFSQLAASDPRSGEHDADYFLSRRFSEDIEEAEWLHVTVARLQSYLDSLETLTVDLGEESKALRQESTLPHDQTWERIQSFLDILVNVLTPKLKEVLALRGIRFYEMEVIDRYGVEIPTHCRMLIEAYELGAQAIEAIQDQVGESHTQLEQCGRDLRTCHSVVSLRMASLMAEIDRMLRDLVAFVPLWLQGIERRRALMLKRSTSVRVADGEGRGATAGDPIDLESESDTVNERWDFGMASRDTAPRDLPWTPRRPSAARTDD